MRYFVSQFKRPEFCMITHDPLSYHLTMSISLQPKCLQPIYLNPYNTSANCGLSLLNIRAPPTNITAVTVQKYRVWYG